MAERHPARSPRVSVTIEDLDRVRVSRPHDTAAPPAPFGGDNRQRRGLTNEVARSRGIRQVPKGIADCLTTCGGSRLGV